MFGGSWGSTLALAYTETHRHNPWLEDGSLLRGAGSLAAIPGIMVNGRCDFQAPIAWAWDLHRVWPRSELMDVDHAGHAGDDPGVTQALVRSTDHFAPLR